MPRVCSISTAPVLTLSPPCLTLSFLSTQVQPGTEKKNPKMKAAQTNMKQTNKQKNHVIVPPVLATYHLIIRVYFLPSFKDDEPALADEEGSSADRRTTDNRYKKNQQLPYSCHSSFGRRIDNG